MKPLHIIESGADEGKGTWIIDQVSDPDCQTIVVTPKRPTAYVSKKSNARYFTDGTFKDFTEIDWDALGKPIN